VGWSVFRKKRGLTLVELIIALVLSSILIAALYRVFISQQRIFMVQDQVADIQQNVRIAIGQMTKEIRMAGYGGNILDIFDNINGFSNIITPANNSITILLADQVGVLKQNTNKGSNQIKVTNASIFNTEKKKYLCLNGLNNYLVQSITADTITMSTPLTEDHIIKEPVYLVKAITYNLGQSGSKTALRRNENTGGGGQPLAENMEGLQLTYFDANGNITTNPQDIRMIRVMVTVKTNLSDPEYKGGDGYRRRILSSYIKVRNIGL
jgi:prepilin-type N-terminal cleavage/methylation domain-containing protein